MYGKKGKGGRYGAHFGGKRKRSVKRIRKYGVSRGGIRL